MIRLAVLQESAETLKNHLALHAPLETGAFCLLREGLGANGVRLLAGEVMLPDPNSWELQEEGVLRPTAQCISTAISRAITGRAGLLFVHSHPDSSFPPTLSSIDRSAFLALARTIAPMLEGPFAAAVVHPEGWSGMLWSDGRLRLIERIVSVGRTIRFLSPTRQVEDSPLDSRQRDALGVIQDRLRPLTVAVIGCGGLGSLMAEQLTRIGIAELLIIDHDKLDTPSNVRRVFGSTVPDLRATLPPPKVEVVGRHLDQLGLGVAVRCVNGDVRTEGVFRTLLDADLVLMGTDTHGSRAVVNDLASTYLLPVIDVGTRVGNRNGVLSGLVAEVRILTPVTPCLWCRQTLNGDVIHIENLPDGERQRLVREGYSIGRVGEPEASVIALTVLGSGLATCAMLALLAEDGNVVSPGYLVDGFFGDAHKTKPEAPVSSCRCRINLGLGDTAAPPFNGPLSQKCQGSGSPAQQW